MNGGVSSTKELVSMSEYYENLKSKIAAAEASAS